MHLLEKTLVTTLTIVDEVEVFIIVVVFTALILLPRNSSTPRCNEISCLPKLYLSPTKLFLSASIRSPILLSKSKADTK